MYSKQQINSHISFPSYPKEWTICFGCVQQFHLPTSRVTWETHLIAYDHSIDATCSTLINEHVHEAHGLIKAWVAGKCTPAQDMAKPHGQEPLFLFPSTHL